LLGTGLDSHRLGRTQLGLLAGARRQPIAPRPLGDARAALFLVSSDADFITGQVLPVNGGLAGWAADASHDEPRRR
jgi:NAD(P)-dependent dehydrogenase (short-subunit alcohol dehydrogenase family)